MVKHPPVLTLLGMCVLAYGTLPASQKLFAAPLEAATQAAPVWPAKIFAPYAYIPYEDAATVCLGETGQKYFTLAFVLSDSIGRPAWDGQDSLDVRDGFYAKQIQAIRAKGGDVIVSFGGAGGKALALTTPNPVELTRKYQNVVNEYRLTWLDFDIEGDTLTKQIVNQHRNQALRQLQDNNPGLRISFTVPGDPTGLETDAIQMLTDARNRGLIVESVNVMTMDYEDEYSQGQKMGDLAISAIKAAHAQLVKIGLNTKVGVTPMIGENDVTTVIFNQQDAAKVLNFAKQTAWVRSVGFWSTNRDQATATNSDNSGIPQKKWAFTNLFKPLTN